MRISDWSSDVCSSDLQLVNQSPRSPLDIDLFCLNSKAIEALTNVGGPAAGKAGKTGPPYPREESMDAAANRLARNIRRIAHLDLPGGGQVVVQDGYAYVGHMKPPHGTPILYEGSAEHRCG